MPNRQICVIGTNMSNISDFKNMIRELDPTIRVNWIGDDSLIEDLLANQGPTPSTIKRLCNYAQMAEEMGACMIINQCSTVSEVSDIYGKLIKIPVLKVDQAMAEKAVMMGDNIALVTTNTTTVGPSERLLESCAKAAGRDVKITVHMLAHAMEALFAGDVRKHNDELSAQIHAIDGQYDVIVLAQGSMIAILPEIRDVKTPVLTSIPLGVKRAVDMVHEMFGE